MDGILIIGAGGAHAVFAMGTGMAIIEDIDMGTDMDSDMVMLREGEQDMWQGTELATDIPLKVISIEIGRMV